MSHTKNIQLDGEWTLFLDRDGVINKRPMNDYVKQWSEFYFIDGVLDAIKQLSSKFKYIFIVTNQQGIGKNIMTEKELSDVHNNMLKEISRHGGKIDAIYYCPDLATKPNNCRKPCLAMAEKAKAAYPELNFQKSVMVGDTMSDMKFGKNAAMTTVYVGLEEEVINPELVDFQFSSLKSFVLYLSAND